MISNPNICFYGKFKSLKHLFMMLNESGNKHGHRVASQLIHKYNGEFRKIEKCNLEDGLKQQVFIWLREKYKKAIFEDVKKLTQKEKTHLYNFIIGKWREHKRDCH